jgi:anti-anti-sigma factor
MPAMPFHAEVKGSAELPVLRLSGDINVAAEAGLATVYAEVKAMGADAVLLDFTATEYINSTGIALIVRLLADARRDRREVRVCGLSPHYLEIFQITRLSDYMRIFDDQASATAAAPSSSATPATAATPATSTGGRR